MFLLFQSWFEAALHIHSDLIMRIDEYAETLQWNLCRSTVASLTAVIEHDVSVATYLQSFELPLHDPHNKLHLEPIPETYQCAAPPWHTSSIPSPSPLATTHLTVLFWRRYDTGFRLAADRLEDGQMVVLMAADTLLGDERLWQGLTSFFEGESSRMLVLSRLELDHSVKSCCTMGTALACHDAYVFRTQLNRSIFHSDQSGRYASENQVVQLLLEAGYELSNPCVQFPLFRHHVPVLSIKRDQHR